MSRMDPPAGTMSSGIESDAHAGGVGLHRRAHHAESAARQVRREGRQFAADGGSDRLVLHDEPHVHAGAGQLHLRPDRAKAGRREREIEPERMLARAPRRGVVLALWRPATEAQPRGHRLLAEQEGQVDRQRSVAHPVIRRLHLACQHGLAQARHVGAVLTSCRLPGRRIARGKPTLRLPTHQVPAWRSGRLGKGRGRRIGDLRRVGGRRQAEGPAQDSEQHLEVGRDRQGQEGGARRAGRRRRRGALQPRPNPALEQQAAVLQDMPQQRGGRLGGRARRHTTKESRQLCPQSGSRRLRGVGLDELPQGPEIGGGGPMRRRQRRKRQLLFGDDWRAA